MKTVGMKIHNGIFSTPPTAAITNSGGRPTDAATNMMATA